MICDCPPLTRSWGNREAEGTSWSSRVASRSRSAQPRPPLISQAQPTMQIQSSTTQMENFQGPISHCGSRPCWSDSPRPAVVAPIGYNGTSRALCAPDARRGSPSLWACRWKPMCPSECVGAGPVHSLLGGRWRVEEVLQPAWMPPRGRGPMSDVPPAPRGWWCRTRVVSERRSPAAALTRARFGFLVVESDE